MTNIGLHTVWRENLASIKFGRYGEFLMWQSELGAHIGEFLIWRVFNLAIFTDFVKSPN